MDKPSNPSFSQKDNDREEPTHPTEKSSLKLQKFQEEIKADIQKYINTHFLNQSSHSSKIQNIEVLFSEEMRKIRDLHSHLTEEFNNFKEQMRLAMWSTLENERTMREDFNKFRENVENIVDEKVEIELTNINKAQGTYLERISDVEKIIAYQSQNMSSKDEINKLKTSINEILEQNIKIEINNLNKIQTEQYKRLSHIEHIIGNVTSKASKEELNKFKEQISEYLKKKVEIDLQNLNKLQSDYYRRMLIMERALSSLSHTISKEEFENFKDSTYTIFEQKLKTELGNLSETQSELQKRFAFIEQKISSLDKNVSQDEFDNLKSKIQQLNSDNIQIEIENLNKLQNEHFQRLIYIEQTISDINPKNLSKSYDNFKNEIQNYIEKKVDIGLENLNKLQDEHYQRLIQIEQSMSNLKSNTSALNWDQIRKKSEGVIEEKLQPTLTHLNETHNEFTERITRIEEILTTMSSSDSSTDIEKYKEQIKNIIEEEFKTDLNNLNKANDEYSKRIKRIEQMLITSSPTDSTENIEIFKDQIKDMIEEEFKTDLQNLNKAHNEYSKRIERIEQMFTTATPSNSAEDLEKFKDQLKNMIEKEFKADFENLNKAHNEYSNRINKIELMITKMDSSVSSGDIEIFKDQIKNILEKEFKTDFQNFNEYTKRISQIEQTISKRNYQNYSVEFVTLKNQVNEFVENKIQVILDKLNETRDEYYRRIARIERIVPTISSRLNSSPDSEEFQKLIKEYVDERIEIDLDNLKRLQDEHFSRMQQLEKNIPTMDTGTLNKQLDDLRQEFLEGVRMLGKRITKNVTDINDRLENFKTELLSEAQSKSKPKSGKKLQSMPADLDDLSFLFEDEMNQVIDDNTMDQLKKLIEQQSKDSKLFMNKQREKITSFETLLSSHKEENRRMYELLRIKTEGLFRKSIVGVFTVAVIAITIQIILNIFF